MEKKPFELNMKCTPREGELYCDVSYKGIKGEIKISEKKGPFGKRVHTEISTNLLRKGEDIIKGLVDYLIDVAREKLTKKAEKKGIVLKEK